MIDFGYTKRRFFEGHFRQKWPFKSTNANLSRRKYCMSGWVLCFFIFNYHFRHSTLSIIPKEDSTGVVIADEICIDLQAAEIEWAVFCLWFQNDCHEFYLSSYSKLTPDQSRFLLNAVTQIIANPKFFNDVICYSENSLS